MRLYNMHNSGNCYKVRLTAYQLGLPLDIIHVDVLAQETRTDTFLTKNPNGRVPLLETPLGLLTESIAILEYAAEDLIPGDAFAAARMRETIQYLSSTMHVAHAHRLRGHRWATQDASFEDMRAKVADNIKASCAYLESHLDFAPFAIGDRLTLADVYLFMLLSWAPGDGVDLAGYPKLHEFVLMMNERASVQAVREKGML